MTDSLDIAKVTKKHKDEWLLFEVIETDEFDRPTRGHLLCHSKDREEIHRVALDFCGADTLIVFTGNPVPPDLAVVL